MDLANKVKNGGVEYIEIDGTQIELTSENLLVTMQGKEGYAFAGEGELGVVLETTITPELKEEGYLREILSKVQNMREDSGFKVLDRINLYVAENAKLEDVIKKSILPLAFMLFWFWMVSTIMKVSGQTDLFWWIFLSGLPFGIHKMRLILIPRGMDTTATLGMAALSVIIGALIGSIMIPVYVIRAVYVFLRYIIGK